MAQTLKLPIDELEREREIAEQIESLIEKLKRQHEIAEQIESLRHPRFSKVGE